MIDEYAHLRQNSMYGPGYGEPGAAALILQAYGVNCATEAETRARVGVLDRMGAFAWSERAELKKAGYLNG